MCSVGRDEGRGHAQAGDARVQDVADCTQGTSQHCNSCASNTCCLRAATIKRADQLLIGLQTAYEKQKAKTKKDSEATSIFHLIGSLTGTPPRLDEVYVLVSTCFI